MGNGTDLLTMPYGPWSTRCPPPFEIPTPFEIPFWNDVSGCAKAPSYRCQDFETVLNGEEMCLDFVEGGSDLTAGQRGGSHYQHHNPNSSMFELSDIGQTTAEASKQDTKTENSYFWKSYFGKTKTSEINRDNKKSRSGRMPHCNV